ncbi:MAG: T9SS type A sorting domain-containing protein [Crocinitomicaceae bacterium]
MAGSFTNSGVNSGCQANNDRDDGWWSFVATSTAITIEETSCTGSGNRRRMIAVHTACGGGTVIGCVQSDPCVTNTLNLTGLTVGVTYHIHIDRRSGGNGATMNGTICLYDTPNADVAFPGSDMGILSCTSTTNRTGSTSGATTHCGVSSAGDHTYQFTTTEVTDITIDLCGSSYDTEVHLFALSNGSCDAGPVASNDDGCGIQSTLTYSCAAAGTYVVVIEGSGANEGNYDMDVIIDNCGCPVPLANDDPCGAIELTVSGSCGSVEGDNTTATDSGIADPGCASYGGADVWYYAIIPASGELVIETSDAGGITDTGIAWYDGSGNCNSPTFSDCNDDGGSGLFSQISQTGLTPGDTVYIRVWEYGGNSVGTFNVCARDPSCASLSTNDYCEDPGILTKVPLASFASSTASIYTADEPDNVASVFCGSIENNSWYQFTATSITETFDISTVTNCVGAGGIQAEVYSFGTTAGCCTGFSSVSNCFNPGSATTGTVTATPLVIGNTYMLMIDGYGGDNCDFIISGWSGTNILPVELTDFEGKALIQENNLTWKTKSESDSKHFVVERSFDGFNFESIGTVEAAGESSSTIHYSFSDYDCRHALTYYRLKQVDLDGTYEKSTMISIARMEDDITIYPNPTTGEVTFTFLPDYSGEFTVVYTDLLGRKVIEDIYVEGNSEVNSNVVQDFEQGVYNVQIFDQAGNLIMTDKLIKE